MKQKYTLVRDFEQNTLIIKEYAELDKEILSLLCEESYTDEDIQNAMAKGDQELISVIRTHNLYPPGVYSQKIAEAISGMYAEDGNPSLELFFDDRELFAESNPDGASEEVEEDIDSEDSSVEVDDLLENELDDDYDEDTKIVSNLKSSLKVSDDDSNDLDSTP